MLLLTQSKGQSTMNTIRFARFLYLAISSFITIKAGLISRTFDQQFFCQKKRSQRVVALYIVTDQHFKHQQINQEVNK